MWEVAQKCFDEEEKGWWVRMEEFREAMDALHFGRRLVGEALREAECRAYAIVRIDEDGHLKSISIVPQRYQCWHCNMWLDMQDDPEDHIDLCLRRQAKIDRTRTLC